MAFIGKVAHECKFWRVAIWCMLLLFVSRCYQNLTSIKKGVK